MSSVESKSDIIMNNKPVIVRRSSFQRLKCSATSQFQLAGSRFSKTALAQLFERVILRSRTILQTTILYLAVFGHKCLCSCAYWFIDMLTKVFAINLIIEESKLSEKSKKFLIRIQRIERIPVDEASIQTSLLKSKTNDEPDKQRVTIPANVSLAQRFLATVSTKTSKSPKNGFLAFSVYGSAAFVYAQFLVLIYGLNSTYTPPGLIFLVVSLAYIGYIILKVVSMKKHEKLSSQHQSLKSSAKFRISPSSTKKYLEFHNKTLSKIQLL